MAKILVDKFDADFLRRIANDSPHSYVGYLMSLARAVESALAADTITLPGPDGEPNETVSAEKFSHLTTEWDGQ